MQEIDAANQRNGQDNAQSESDDKQKLAAIQDWKRT
jgi:hypothetical protein